ncbi:unnamed protein product [Pleuronectes platessa]|uniref:Uncharacterized protein n=1 Tax=Pleuronectes platessa TaxID=8262 RepID=A0A9N7UUB2_PLEPL|nr:unnamed protein product [Pleuronectes platessa]
MSAGVETDRVKEKRKTIKLTNQEGLESDQKRKEEIKDYQEGNYLGQCKRGRRERESEQWMRVTKTVCCCANRHRTKINLRDRAEESGTIIRAERRESISGWKQKLK